MKRAFTLIEALVVVAIIALIVATFAGAISKARWRADFTREAATIKTQLSNGVTSGSLPLADYLRLDGILRRTLTEPVQVMIVAGHTTTHPLTSLQRAAIDRAFPWIDAGIAKCASRPVMVIRNPAIFEQQEPNFRLIRLGLLALKPDPNRPVPLALSATRDALQYIEYCVRDPWAEIYPLAYYYGLPSLKDEADLMIDVTPPITASMFSAITAAR